MSLPLANYAESNILADVVVVINERLICPEKRNLDVLKGTWKYYQEF